MRLVLRNFALTALCAGLAACGGNVAGAPASGSPSLEATHRGPAYAYSANAVRVCPENRDPARAECLALLRTGIVAHPNAPAGYGPSQLQSAYNLPSSSEGKGEIVAVVDAFDDPNAASDLATYRAEFGLPACNKSNPCFKKVNQAGRQGSYPTGSPDWGGEESLDVDMVSAICPNCTIILIEANSNRLTDLGKSVKTAVEKLHANAVSNSYIGYGDTKSFGSRWYDYPGHIITAAGGDGGYLVGTPAGFPTVVSVGGTSLFTSSGSRGWTEKAWAGTGSGCTTGQAKPKWQTDSGCKYRTMNDVAADADPNTGVAVYDTYDSGGWIVLGGTSVASPIIASVYALAGNITKMDAAESLYGKGASLYDVTTGSNGACKRTYLCTAGTGYDGPTGNGTPNGTSAF